MKEQFAFASGLQAAHLDNCSVSLPFILSLSRIKIVSQNTPKGAWYDNDSKISCI